MRPRQSRAGAVRLGLILAALLLCIWLLYRIFIAVPPAPPPTVSYGRLPVHAQA
jgi:hypothetical protein